jgi:hypothetical protein
MRISEINTQIIRKNGKPVFAVIPYDAYIDFMEKQSKPEETETNLYASKLNDLVCSMGISVREHV